MEPGRAAATGQPGAPQLDAAQAEDDSQGPGCDGEGSDAPGGAGELPAEGMVERPAPGAGEGNGRRRRSEHEGQLVAVVSGEEAVAGVNKDSGTDHGPDDGRCPDRRQEAGGEQRTSDELSRAEEVGVRARSTEAELSQEPGGPVDAAATEEAEELLRAVCRQGGADGHADDEESDAHGSPPWVGIGRVASVACSVGFGSTVGV